MKRWLLSVSMVLLYTVTLSASAVEPVKVKTAPLATLAIYPEYSAPAAVVSLNESIVSAEIEARVDKMSVKVGDSVEAGAVLVRLDCTEHRLLLAGVQANLEALEQRYELAGKRLQRTRQLTLKQSVAEELLDEREAEYAVLGAEIKALAADAELRQLDVSRCVVASPFRALVVERFSAVGEFVKKGTVLVKLVDLDAIELSAQVPAGDVPALEKAGTLQFEYYGKRYALTLRVMVSMIDTDTGNREVRLVFAERTLLPGAFGRLVWQETQAHLPADLVVRRDGVLGVFTVADGRAVFHPLPKASSGRTSAVTFDDASAVVVEGHFSLKHDMPVAIAND